MLTFDAITREVCTARRTTTTTPLQALVLLNDPQFIEASRVLAERLLRTPFLPIETRIETAFRMATSHRPTPSQLNTLRHLYDEQLRIFEDTPPNAASFVAVGESEVDASLPVPQLAATAALADALMNLDQFVTLQ